jgi:non-specific serine/threonine protein kinase
MIGKGAFGKVNMGLHILSHKLVAVKSLNKKLLDENSRRKMLNEVMILRLLRHQNICK